MIGPPAALPDPSRAQIAAEKAPAVADPDCWTPYLDGCALYSLVLLLATGVWLTFFFQASAPGAFSSTVAFSTTPIGYLVRQVHHWSAVTFVTAAFLRVARMFLRRAYRKPYESTWVVGVSVLVLASFDGFTGYSLPSDAQSGTGLRIADALLLSIPFAGGAAAYAINGGMYPGQLLIPHLSIIHVYAVPVAIMLLAAVQFAAVGAVKRLSTVLDRSPDGRRRLRDYVLRTLAGSALTAGAMLALASSIEINPVDAIGPYNDWTVVNPAVPGWFAAFLDGALRLGPAVETTIAGHPIPSIFWPGVLMPVLALVLTLGWPWIEHAFLRGRSGSVAAAPSFAPYRVGIGVAVLAGGTMLTLAASDDQQALALHLPIQLLVRAYQIALPCVSVVAGLLAIIVATELRLRRSSPDVPAESTMQLRANERGGFDAEPVASK